MDDKKQIFLESYKALDGYLKEIQKSDRGITSFIDNYEDTNDRKAREIYYQLKHLRWIRNRLTDEAVMVSDADIDDLRYVCQYFMKDEYTKTDVLSQNREERIINDKKQAEKTEPALTPIIDEEVAGLDEKDATIIMRTISDNELVIPSDGIAEPESINIEGDETLTGKAGTTVAMSRTKLTEAVLKKESDGSDKTEKTKENINKNTDEKAPVSKLLIFILLLASIWLCFIVYLQFLK